MCGLPISRWQALGWAQLKGTNRTKSSETDPAQQAAKHLGFPDAVNLRDGKDNTAQQCKDTSHDVKGYQPLGLQRQQNNMILCEVLKPELHRMMNFSAI
jgi:hypothetical protein